MPKTLIQVNTADGYTEQGGANINSVYESRGGWVTFSAQVFAQIQHSPLGAQQGQEQWSEEFVLPSGAHYLQPGLIGIRFRSFTAGNPVQISAAIFFKDEPAMVLGGSGISTPTPVVTSLNFQHNQVAVATEPTADFVDAAALNPANIQLVWTVVDDAANTRVKITPVFSWANPTIFPNDVSTGPTASGSRSTAGLYFQSTSSTGGGIWSTGNATNFTAFEVGVTGEAAARFQIRQDGQMFWSSGSAAGDTFVLRQSVGQLVILQQLSVGTTVGNGAGTLTVNDRIFSGGPSTGGIWVDGATSSQFMGSNSGTKMGFFNGGWFLLMDGSGNTTFQGTFGFATGAGNGAAGSAASTSITQNKICGSVLFTGQSNTASAMKSFIVTNNFVTAVDTVIVNMNNSSTFGGVAVCSAIVTGGSFTITFFCTTGNAGVNYGFNYTVIKSATN